MKYEEKLSTEVLKDIEQRVSRARNCLRASTTAWIGLGREFADAKTKLKPIAFERFVNEVGMTKSIADKLVIIGRRKTLFDEANIDYISTVDGWTVLYELAKLDDKKSDVSPRRIPGRRPSDQPRASVMQETEHGATLPAPPSACSPSIGLPSRRPRSFTRTS